MNSQELRKAVLDVISERDGVAYPEIFEGVEDDIGAIFLEIRHLDETDQIERVGPGRFRICENGRETLNELNSSDFLWQDEFTF